MNNILMNSRTFRTPLLLYAVAVSLALGAARSVRKWAFPEQRAAWLTAIT